MTTVTPGVRRALRLGGLVLAAGLLLAAVAVAGREVDWAVLRHASPWHLAALAAAVGMNIVLTAVLFWVVTRSFDARPTVGLARMTALIAVSNLLNYLPLIRAGLVGRAAYLKARHALPLRQSVVILAVVLVVTAATFALAAVGLVLVPGVWGWLAVVAAAVLLSLGTGPVSRRVLRREVIDAWAWLPLRFVDMLVSAFRLWVAFAVMGNPIGYTEAVVIGAAGLLVRLVGVTPNGLGLSEWVVAGLTAALTPMSTAVGAAAALLDRAVEVLVMSAAGLVAAWRLRAPLREPHPDTPSAPSTASPRSPDDLPTRRPS